MSHLQTLSNLKATCEETGKCTNYQAALQQEQSKIDAYTTGVNQSALAGGIIIGIIGLVIMVTPFIKPLQRVQQFLLPKLIIVAPVLIGLIGGALIGFVIAFGACFKQECSAAEGTAIFTVPVLSLLITVPLTMKLVKKKQAVKSWTNRPLPLLWIVLGALLILFAASNTVSDIQTNNRYNQQQKRQLQSGEL